MSLIERLRKAEQQGREVAWQELSRAYNSLDEAQSQLRRKMRIHPRTAKAKVPLFVSVQGDKEEEAPHHPIVSINGQDLPPADADKGTEQVA
jgi:hypothetical protein